jgi:error-prone DNA polymerase
VLQHLPESTTESMSGLRAVRLGLNRIAHLSESAMQRIMQSRAAVTGQQGFTSVEDLAARADLDRNDLNALAAAGALKSLAGNRHQALWQTSGQSRLPSVLKQSRIDEPALMLPGPSEGQDLIADYASLGLTLGKHPLALLRETLNLQRIQTADFLKHQPHGRLTRAAGLVTHRQRPSTANGTLFISLEDETGMINVIIWPDVLERFYKAVLNAQLMVVYGVWQRDQRIDPNAPGQVCNLLAQRVEDQSNLLHQLGGELCTHSRDFH